MHNEFRCRPFFLEVVFLPLYFFFTPWYSSTVLVVMVVFVLVESADCTQVAVVVTVLHALQAGKQHIAPTKTSAISSMLSSSALGDLDVKCFIFVISFNKVNKRFDILQCKGTDEYASLRVFRACPHVNAYSLAVGHFVDERHELLEAWRPSESERIGAFGYEVVGILQRRKLKYPVWSEGEGKRPVNGTIGHW